jgi:hypothetical protein
MAQQSQGPDPSDRIFQDLRNKNEEVKYRAAGELRDLMSLLSRGKIYRRAEARLQIIC